ncbi:hypothetical protein [Streptomyces sp. NPDC001205]
MALFGRGKRHSTVSGASCPDHHPCSKLADIPIQELDSRLRLVVTPVADLGSDSVTAQLGGGLAALLVAMGAPGTSAAAIPAHFTPRWNTTPPDLLVRALGNMKRDRLAIEDVAGQNGGPSLYVVTGQDGLPGAAHVLRLEEVLGQKLPHGALVAMPSNNRFYAVPILGGDALGLLDPLVSAVRGLAEQGAVLSQDVFWLDGGRLDPLNASFKDGELRFFPSDAFKQLLPRLRG